MDFGSSAACDGGLPPRENWLVAGGMRWHYLVWGEAGPPCVLWHGVTSSARGWWRVAPALARLGYQVFAPDLPGHGLSDDAPGSYAITTTARLLDAWLEASRLEAPIILGHSWGGMNAVVHAGLPDPLVRARALVLEDPALALRAEPGPYVTSFSRGVGQPEAVLRADFATANPRWHPCDVWWKGLAHSRVRRAAVEGFFVGNAGVNLIDDLARLSMPVHVILGDPAFGGIWSAEQIDTLPQLAPHVGLEIVAGSTHNLHRDSFAPFIAAVETFVQHV